MGFFDWVLLIIATIVANLVVKKSNTKHKVWAMIIATILLWIACYVIIFLFKFSLLLLPFIIVGLVLAYILHKSKSL